MFKEFYLLKNNYSKEDVAILIEKTITDCWDNSLTSYRITK